jgi:hypothetical protein
MTLKDGQSRGLFFREILKSFPILLRVPSLPRPDSPDRIPPARYLGSWDMGHTMGMRSNSKQNRRIGKMEKRNDR